MHLSLNTRDLTIAQDYLSKTFGTMRLHSSDPCPLARMSGTRVGSVRLARITIGFDLAYTVEPTGLIAIGVLHAGAMPRHGTCGDEHSFGPGDVVLFAQPDRPCAGSHSHLDYDLAAFDPTLLARVADPVGRRAALPRLLDHRPVSRAAGRQLGETIDFVARHVAEQPEVSQTPLVTSSAAQLLAAAVLTAFPNDAVTDPAAADRRDAHSISLRRAVAFIEENAHRDISVADIAAAARVTVRALQYAFARHRGVSPTAYLRQVRLVRAHDDLVDADPSGGDTVAVVAARWGFAHPGRFAALHRRRYGHSPRDALRRW